MIDRSLEAAAREPADLLILGGGIYGVTLALESARRGLRPVLIERGDFGNATSWNSLRIVHGGLRYLQRMDLVRFRESVAERSWFLRHFPDQVEPLPCLMPLYGEGVRWPAIFRVALWVNDWLSSSRNRGLREDRRIPNGAMLDATETTAVFQAVDPRGLRGGALWYDAVMPDSQRLLVELLRWACASGARTLNYVEAKELVVEDGAVAGVRAIDRATDAVCELRAPVVVNTAGPWSRLVAEHFDRDVPELFRPMLAFNLLLDREPISEFAVAVAPRRSGGQTYFIHPWKDRVFAGTYQAPWSGTPDDGPPGEESIAAFLAELNEAVPGFELVPDDVLRVHWGLLPAASEGSAELALRPSWVDHGALGGPKGLFSSSGVKFTTARLVAERSLASVLRAQDDRPLPPADGPERPEPREVPSVRDFDALVSSNPARARRLVESIADEECARYPEDVLLRRTDWGMDPRAACESATFVRRVFMDREFMDREFMDREFMDREQGDA